MTSSYYSETQFTTALDFSGIIDIQRVIVEVERADVVKTLTISKMLEYEDGLKGPLEVLGKAGIFP